MALLIPVFIASGLIGAWLRPQTHAANPSAPTSGTPVCGQTILNSPYSYNGAPGTFSTSGTPAGLPTFGSAGTNFPGATQVVVIAAGDNTSSASGGAYQAANTIFYFEPGTHTISQVMFTGHDSIYIGGYSAGIGKAIIDGGGASGGSYLSSSKPAADGTVRNTWEYLTIQNYTSSNNNAVMGNINGTYGSTLGNVDVGDTYKYDTIGPNEWGYRSGQPPATGESNGGGYGIIMADDTTVQYNCLTQNAQGAFNGYGNNINLSNNEISQNGLGEYPDNAGPGGSPYSCGCSGGGKMAFSSNATVDYNFVHDNYNAGIWLDFDNTGADISYNYIKSNWGEGIFYEASYNANITYNTLVGNGWASNGAWPAGVGGGDCFGGISCTNGLGPSTGAGGGNPYAAIYLPNSGGNANLTTIKRYDNTTVPARYAGQILVQGNNLSNNFGGVDVYSDTNRFPDNLNNDSACSTPLDGQSTTYYRQTKFLGVDNANISGSTVTAISPGAQTYCSGYDTGDQGDGYQDIQPKTPDVGMAVYNSNTNAFLGNIATATSATSFTLDRSPGNVTGAGLIISAYGGCGPADYFGGGPSVNTGQPSAAYWDNCIWGGRNVTVTGNTFTMDAGTVAGCNTTNKCGYMMARIQCRRSTAYAIFPELR